MSDRELISEVIHVPWNTRVWLVNSINTIEKNYHEETIFIQGFVGEKNRFGYGKLSHVLIIADQPLE